MSKFNWRLAAARGPNAGSILGCLVFILFYGVRIIDPHYIAWLISGDKLQSYLGWVFYRREPWTLPLGHQHALGLEQASSIVYTDSIPSLAIFFKALSALLPSTFQYFGLWEFASFALMGCFAWKLMSLYTKNRLTISMATLFFLISPILILRVNFHVALSGQWLILAALFLYFRSKHTGAFRQWGTLLCFAATVHAYLMFMVLALLCAFVLRCVFVTREIAIASIVRSLSLILASLVGTLWLCGYFGDLELSNGGFGVYSMNLLSPFVPVSVPGFLVHGIPAATDGQYEGFAYLGIGFLFVTLWTFARYLISHDQHASSVGSVRRAWPIIVLCILLTALAISTTIGFGKHILLTLEVPTPLIRPLNIFRASGRMFWPVYYALMLGVFRLLLRRKNWEVLSVIFVGLVMQVADVHSFVVSREGEIDASAANVLPTHSSAVWHFAEANHRYISVIPGGVATGTEQLQQQLSRTYLAAEYGLAIDTTYYARAASENAQRERTRRHDDFLQGMLRDDAVYIVEDKLAGSLTVLESLFPADTGIGTADGFLVVVPKWFSKAPPNKVNLLHRPTSSVFPEIGLDQLVAVSEASQANKYLEIGWTKAGVNGAWSQGDVAMLVFHLPQCSSSYLLHMSVVPYRPKNFDSVQIRFKSAGGIAVPRAIETAPTDLIFPISPESAASCNFVADIEILNPRSPADAGESVDGRKLGLLLQSFKLTK